MQARAALPFALAFVTALLAGCSGAEPPAAGEEPAPAGAAEPWLVEFPACIHWHVLVDAPAADFPAGTGHTPLPGTTPGTVLLQGEGFRCSSSVHEVWEGWPVEAGGLLPRLVLTDNATRAALYAAAGLPAENASLNLFYGTHTPPFNEDGVARSDGSHGLWVSTASGLGAEPAPATFLLPGGNGTVAWSATEGTNLQGGRGEVGSSVMVGPRMVEEWRGEGTRQETAAIRIAWTPA